MDVCGMRERAVKPQANSGVKRQSAVVPKELLNGTAPEKTVENLPCTYKDDLSFCPQLVC